MQTKINVIKFLRENIKKTTNKQQTAEVIAYVEYLMDVQLRQKIARDKYKSQHIEYYRQKSKEAGIRYRERKKLETTNQRKRK